MDLGEVHLLVQCCVGGYRYSYMSKYKISENIRWVQIYKPFKKFQMGKDNDNFSFAKLSIQVRARKMTNLYLHSRARVRVNVQ